MERPAQRDRIVDPYETLDVSREATSEQIHYAYRQKAKKFHPDRKGGDSSKMAEVNAAYALLSNAEMRSRFDRGETIKPKTIEDDARDQLCTMWAQALVKMQDRDPPDMLKLVKDAVKEGVKKCKTEATSARRRMNKLEKVKKYLKPSVDSPGFLEHILGEKITEQKKIVENFERLEGMGPIILEILKLYSWDGPEPKIESSDTPLFIFSKDRTFKW